MPPGVTTMTRAASPQAFWKELDAARLCRLLQDAVRVYSPSYAEAPAARVFAARLEQAGLAVERMPVASRPGDGERHNLVVRIGPQPASMLWVGHIDTIEAVHGFKEPWTDGDLLYGLGAADMKGGCAAMVEALIAVHRSGVPLARGLCLALVVGEEEYGDGALALIEAVRAPLVIVGEPTDLLPCTGHNGYLECRLTAQGSRAHAAVPEFGANAIHAMLTWVLAIFDALLAPGLAGEVVANPREIQGGSTLFVVPAACQAMLDLHWRPGIDPRSVAEAMERARRIALANHPLCGLSAENTFSSSSFLNPPDHPLLAPLWPALAAAGLPGTPTVFRSHSDAAVFQAAGALAVVCGPGKLAMAHSPEEQVSMAQVEQAARLYAALAWEALA